MLYNWKNRNEIDSLINIFNKQALVRYKANKSCLLVVNRFTIKENWHLNYKSKYGDKNDIDRDCYEGLYPVPNFWDSQYITNDTESRLPKDFLIYVLEAHSGKFWNDKYLTKGKYMPEAWKNGYSKGVAISKKRKVIIYWFIIW